MPVKIDEKLALDAIKSDKESHIKINHGVCRAKCTVRYCTFVCPGHLYSYNAETDEMVVEYAGCLECGTCMIACVESALDWSYPAGGFGVQYRFG